MNKRILYAIPTTGLALTSMGCGDPIVADAEAVTALDQALPYSGSYQYQYQGQNLTIDIANLDFANITINKDLTTTTLQESGTITITDDTGAQLYSGDIATAFDGAVTVVEKGAKYTIKFTEKDPADVNNPLIINLTCDLNNDVNLACTDDNALAWAFKLL
jgi:hypothetical protein